MSFLQDVKEYYGNVELDSLKQASIVNTEGIYYVGNIKESCKEFLVSWFDIHVVALEETLNIIKKYTLLQLDPNMRIKSGKDITWYLTIKPSNFLLLPCPPKFRSIRVD